MLKNFNINYLIFFCQQLFETVILSIKYYRWFFSLSTGDLFRAFYGIQSWFFSEINHVCVKDGATAQTQTQQQKCRQRGREIEKVRGSEVERIYSEGESVIICWFIFSSFQCKLIHLLVYFFNSINNNNNNKSHNNNNNTENTKRK